MEELDYIQEMNAYEVLRFPKFHVSAVIMNKSYQYDDCVVENVFFGNFEKESDAMKYAADIISKYREVCRECEITRDVGTLCGIERDRIFFAEPWRSPRNDAA